MDKIQSLTGMLDLYDDGNGDNLSVKIFETERLSEIEQQKEILKFLWI